MSDQFLGEIRIVGFNFAPFGWAFCDGQILPIQQFAAVFSLLGTNYGGNGTTNFGLPNLQGRVPVNQGQGPGLTPYVMGEVAGASSVALTLQTMPSHTHLVNCLAASGDTGSPVNNLWAKVQAARGSINLYGTTASTTMSPQALGSAGNAGQGQAHNNMSPYLVLNICIALAGIFPSRN